MTNEVQLLIEMLEKKEGILQQILKKSKAQLELSGEDCLDVEKFDALVDEKDILLQDMEKVDETFDSTFQKIRDELFDQLDHYKAEIQMLQKKIVRAVDLGSEIHTTEMRTKDQLSAAILRSKKAFSQKRSTMKAAVDYYKASNNLKFVDSYFMDQKK